MPRIGTYCKVYANEKGERIFPYANALAVDKKNGLIVVQIDNDRVWNVDKKFIDIIRHKPNHLEQFLVNLAGHINTRHDQNGDEMIQPLYTKQWLKQQVDMIKSHYLVEDIYFTENDEMVIETQNLLAEDFDENKSYKNFKIGKMRIIFRPSPDKRESEGVIDVYNMSWRSGTYDHPHINRGEVCFGDAKEIVEDCFGLNLPDLYGVVDALLRMMTSFWLNDSEYTDWAEDRKRLRRRPRRFRKVNLKWN